MATFRYRWTTVWGGPVRAMPRADGDHPPGMPRRMTSASVPIPGQPRPRSEAEPPALRRVISRNMLLLFVIGDMLGAGIYALVGEVGGRVGGAIWTSFLL